MSDIKWECPHCGHPAGTRGAEHEKFDWEFDDARHQKELWRCEECDGWYFTYWKLERITALEENGANKTMEHTAAK
jgi:ribosomal protein L37AE/L43A